MNDCSEKSVKTTMAPLQSGEWAGTSPQGKNTPQASGSPTQGPPSALILLQETSAESALAGGAPILVEL